MRDGEVTELERRTLRALEREGFCDVETYATGREGRARIYADFRCPHASLPDPPPNSRWSMEWEGDAAQLRKDVARLESSASEDAGVAALLMDKPCPLCLADAEAGLEAPGRL